MWGRASGDDITPASPLARFLLTFLSLTLNHTMRPHTVWRSLSLLQRAPIRCNPGRRAFTNSATRIPDFAFAFE